MSGAKFTPGPWKVQRVLDSHFGVVLVDKDTLPTVKVCEAVLADAHLIAAAPKLYEALSDMLTVSQGAAPKQGTEGHQDWCDHCEEVRLRARAALAAARGEEVSGE